MSERNSVIIAGAGLAGLVAAYELSKHGYGVTVLEAATTAGGRVRTLRAQFADDLHADAGAMFLPSNHSLPLQYAAEFKLPLQPLQPAGNKNLFYVCGQRLVTGKGIPVQWPAAFNLKAVEQGLMPAALAQKYAGALLGSIGDPHNANWPPDTLKDLDNQSFADLMRFHGASDGAVTLASLPYLNTWGDGVESYSALFQLRDQFLERNSAGTQLIVGGNDQLPRAFAAALKNSIWYGAEVQSISQDADCVRVTSRSGGNLKTWTADYLVCALPFSVLRRVAVDPPFSPPKQRAIQQLPNTSVMRIFLQFREQFWLEEGLTGSAFTDLPIMTVYPMFNQPGPRGILSCYVAGPDARMIEAMSEDARIAFALGHMEKFYPRVRYYFETGATVSWSSDPHACGGYLYCRPGQLIAFRGIASAPEGRVHFAGDHTSAWPGWMQGALQSGCRCANEIAQAG